MSDHSIYSPSGAHRWLNCFACIPLSEGIESKSSVHSENGTYAHELAATGIVSNKPVKDCVKYIDKEKFSKTELFTSEMIGFVQTYVDTIKSFTNRGVTFKGIEYKVNISNVIGVPGQSGTADYLLYRDELYNDEIQVHDLKYGMSPVTAKENKQLMLYALGFIDFLSLLYDIPSDIKVRLVIHQPRLYKVDEWVTNLNYLEKFGTEVKTKVKLIEDIRKEPVIVQDEDFGPGEKTCCWCPIKGNCESCAKFNLDTISELFESFPTADNLEKTVESEIKNIHELSGERQSIIYGRLGLFTKWMGAFKEQMLIDLQSGKEIPGYKAVLGSSTHRAWRDKKEAEEILKKSVRLKQDEMYRKTLCTPTQALTLVEGKKGKTEKVLSLSVAGSKRPVIAKSDDKREEVTKSISDMFDNIEDNFDDLLQ